jgi:hypothetical protein
MNKDADQCSWLAAANNPLPLFITTNTSYKVIPHTQSPSVYHVIILAITTAVSASYNRRNTYPVYLKISPTHFQVSVTSAATTTTCLRC